MHQGLVKPYPNFFILPLDRLLQVRYLSNKTVLFQTKLTDLLHSRKRRKTSLEEGERDSKKDEKQWKYLLCVKRKVLNEPNMQPFKERD